MAWPVSKLTNPRLAKRKVLLSGRGTATLTACTGRPRRFFTVRRYSTIPPPYESAFTISDLIKIGAVTLVPGAGEGVAGFSASLLVKNLRSELTRVLPRYDAAVAMSAAKVKVCSSLSAGKLLNS